MRALSDWLEAALPEAAFAGWTDAALARAARTANLSKGQQRLAAPRGALDLIDAWAAAADEAVSARLSEPDVEALKIREKVRLGVVTRLNALEPHHDAARRALARLAMPDGVGDGARILWRAADVIWRGLGDRSTDANFYSKRAILSGVIATTSAVWAQEHDPERPRAWAMLDARINNVMQFEKWKRARASAPNAGRTGLDGLARLRYGGGRARPRQASRW
ncbi:MAG: COQ9 family protein [Maricaulaceae bacterium]